MAHRHTRRKRRRTMHPARRACAYRSETLVGRKPHEDRHPSARSGFGRTRARGIGRLRRRRRQQRGAFGDGRDRHVDEPDATRHRTIGHRRQHAGRDTHGLLSFRHGTRATPTFRRGANEPSSRRARSDGHRTSASTSSTPAAAARQHDTQPRSDRRALLDRQPHRTGGHRHHQLQQQRRRDSRTTCTSSPEPAASPARALARRRSPPGPLQQTLNLGTLVAGDYNYRCDVHPSTMSGGLTITP